MAHDEGTESDSMGESYPIVWKADLTKADEHRIRLDCYIPKSVKLRFNDGKQDTVVRVDSHEVCLYEAMFHACFRLPFL